MSRQMGPSKGMIVLVNDDTQESTLIIVEPVHVSDGEYNVLTKEGGKLSITVKKDSVIYGELESGVTHATANVGTGDGATTNFTATITDVVPGSLSITVDGSVSMVDNGDGTLSGDGGTGTLDYATGALSIDFTVAPVNTATIDADYFKYV